MSDARMSRRKALGTMAAGLTVLGARGPAAAEPMEPRQRQAPELLVRGGRIVNADGTRFADVRIVDGTITGIGANLRPGPGARVMDATDRLVLPGGIDPHTHLQPAFIDDLTSGSMAALAGGITTVGTFASPRLGETPLDAIDRLATQVVTDAIADVILHVSTWPPTQELAAMMPALAGRGQPSIKVFMTRADFSAHLPAFIGLLEAARDAGVVTLVHCEDGALLAAAVRRLEAEGRTALRWYGESRPVVAEVAATQQAAALCESTRAPMYVVHLSGARALEACRPPREAGLPFFVETRPLYLHLTDERMSGPDAPLHIGQPPLRTAADVEALWQGIIGGAIDVLATDHAPWTHAQKMDPALTVARVRPGVSNLQFMLPMYFSEGVGKRGLSLERFVETTSTNAARIFGLYPQKGVIREGADGDLVIWDPARSNEIRAEADLSKSDYTVYEGWQVTGWPIATIRRGDVVFENGAITGSLGSGRLIARQRWRP